jgi:uncharacterized peroxidase-related enzyme
MSFLNEIPEDQLTDEAGLMFRQAENEYGFVPNLIRVFGQHPDVMNSWDELLDSIRSRMDARRYELVTLAAARTLKSSYCMLAHGSIVLRDFYDSEQLIAIANDFRDANLSEVDIAIMAYAQKVSGDATTVSQQDFDGLRNHGLADNEIFDVAAAAAARCFFSKMMDALGTLPDQKYLGLDEDLRNSLTVGRPISTE